MTKLTLAAGVACAALIAGAASAADLPSRKAAPVYAPLPPAFSWTGLYGGVNIGYTFGNGDQDRGGALTSVGAATGTAGWTVPSSLNGVTGGGQVGFNYQFNPWLVVGLEADIQASDAHAQTSGAGAFDSLGQAVALTGNKSVDWFGTARARIGVTPLIPMMRKSASAELC